MEIFYVIIALVLGVVAVFVLRKPEARRETSDDSAAASAGDAGGTHSHDCGGGDCGGGDGG